jgi:Contact-dependent growth inhibition CdiA C-terminal domain
MHTNYALFEAFDNKYYTKIFFDTETGGFVVAHKEHGKNEIAGNKTIALLLVKIGYQVVLLGNQPNVISADATLNGEVWEFKTIMETVNMSGAVQKDIKRGKRQAANILIFIDQLYTANDITKGIYNAVKFDKKQDVAKIGILFQNGDLINMTRAEILDESFREKFLEK